MGTFRDPDDADTKGSIDCFLSHALELSRLRGHDMLTYFIGMAVDENRKGEPGRIGKMGASQAHGLSSRQP